MFLLICSNISFRKKNTASPQWDCETSCGRCTPDDPDPSNASPPDRGGRFTSTGAGTNIHWLTQQESREAKNAAKIAAKDPDLLWGSSQEHPWHARVVQPEVQMVWRSIWTQHLWRPKSGWAVRSRPWKRGHQEISRDAEVRVTYVMKCAAVSLFMQPTTKHGRTAELPTFLPFQTYCNCHTPPILSHCRLESGKARSTDSTGH